MKKIFSIKRSNQNEQGFTLVELLITILIIGILAAIAVLVFSGQQKAAIDASVKSDVANARSFIPGVAGKVTPTATFAQRVAVTDRNTAVYAVSSDSMNACYQVSHVYSPSEITTYRYLTTEGLVKEGSCSDFIGSSSATSVQINPSNVNTPEAGASVPEASKPGSNDSTAGTGNTAKPGTGGETIVITPPTAVTNEYVDGNVTLANIHNDWAGVYQARLTVTPKQNKAALWTMKWTDPSVTGIESSPNVDCSVASGGVITCSSRQNHYTTNNLQWGQTITVEVQLRTTNKNTAPANPTVAVTAVPN